jgi:hypothetical protein
MGQRSGVRECGVGRVGEGERIDRFINSLIRRGKGYIQDVMFDGQTQIDGPIDMVRWDVDGCRWRETADQTDGYKDSSAQSERKHTELYLGIHKRYMGDTVHLGIR